MSLKRKCKSTMGIELDRTSRVGARLQALDEAVLMAVSDFSCVFLYPTQGIGDVSGDHEIQLGDWHHGRVATHGD